MRRLRDSVHETEAAIPEYVVQCIWYDQLFEDDELETDDGKSVRVLSPGWWNHGEGPDFKGAQLEVDGEIQAGDVEVHLEHGAWRQHGHHLDARYDDVLLSVVLTTAPPVHPPVTSAGRRVPSLLLSRYLEADIREVASQVVVEEYPYDTVMAAGHCAAITEAYGSTHAVRLLVLAGEWRLVNKARALRERMERVGNDQAIYEHFLSACGYSRYKHHFGAVARQLPYERVQQLAKQDPLLVETAFLQIAGLLPDSLPEGTTGVPHFARLRALRRDHLGGLRSLPLAWKHTGVRPNNYPERRLAGAARFLARTAREGLANSLSPVWREPFTQIERRRAWEELFPSPMGFWADHCSWAGKRLAKPTALLGPNRVRSIIGNVFVPAALAEARANRDRRREEAVLEFFAELPKESDNKVLKAMVPRVFGDVKPAKLTFRVQQGLIQVYQDWCEPNPSCRNCSIIPFLDVGYSSKGARDRERAGN